ncbi:dockerin type I repeat-containing protein, partial [uncultured Ruminococcus sp.]|uniref:dockerin type I repeat-containing protein n=1 Tax=uncultured Ruminococcus sp. TaxID=165186 RepID=UPI00293144C9
MKIKSVLSLSLCMAMMMSVSVRAESRMLGDVDGDGEISITDATVIQRYTVGIKTTVAVTSSVADIDGDHAVTVMDASHLQRWMVNVSDSYPISKPVYEPSPTDRYVTVEGVTFDLKKVPSEVMLTDTSISLMLIPKSEIDPHDITTVVNNGRYINRIDYTDSRF